MELKKGDRVKTVHGEKLRVLDVKIVLVKRNGKATGKTEKRFLANSGGHKCWFPASESKKIKGKK
jgi:hypothetical protein